MVIAYSYRLKYTDDCYWIFLDEILLATINESSAYAWDVNIKISGEHYVFTKSGRLNPSVNIYNMNAGEISGDISVPLFPFFFRRSTFLRSDGSQISWFSKNFFSFHWTWELNNDILLEGVEDFARAYSSGVIKVSSYLHEPHLLTIAGIFLSICRKRRRLFGLFDLRYKTKAIQKKYHYLPEGL